MQNNKRSVFIISILFISIFFLARCINKTQAFNDPRGKNYAGAESCRQCHQAIYDSALLSAHFTATTAASENNIRGDFTKGKNSFVYDEHTMIVMEKRDSGLYQVKYVDGKETEVHRFDITFGSRNAQTWLYWEADKTYELPVSYYSSVHSWATSPGFSSKKPDFRRFIGRDCFECHSSHIVSKLNASTAGIDEVLVRNSLVYGIDCERCHGAAANHVNFHLENPEEKTAKYIISNKALTQQQQLDACALCHSGNDKVKIESRFRFKPGDAMADFFMDRPKQQSNADFDVHGNQFRLLSESKCFLGSKTMTCGSCHDPHKNAGNDLALYSQKCMGCHNDASHNTCSMAASLGNSIKENCIDCHMPKKPSNAISFELAGSSTKSSYLLRTHRIAIYAADQ